MTVVHVAYANYLNTHWNDGGACFAECRQLSPLLPSVDICNSLLFSTDNT